MMMLNIPIQKFNVLFLGTSLILILSGLWKECSSFSLCSLTPLTYLDAEKCCRTKEMELLDWTKFVSESESRTHDTHRYFLQDNIEKLIQQRSNTSSSQDENFRRFSLWTKRNSDLQEEEEQKDLLTEFWKSSVNNLFYSDFSILKKCPILQWSPLGHDKPWMSSGFCHLKYDVVCISSKNNQPPLNQDFFESTNSLGNSNTLSRRKRETAKNAVRTRKTDICHVAPTKTGFYISQEKLSYEEANLCCMAKGQEILGHLPKETVSSLKDALNEILPKNSDPLWIAQTAVYGQWTRSNKLLWNFTEGVVMDTDSSNNNAAVNKRGSRRRRQPSAINPTKNGATSNTNNNKQLCSSLSVQNGDHLFMKHGSCKEHYQVVCESRTPTNLDGSSFCSLRTNFLELEGGVYLFSNKKVPYSEASTCCRQQNMNLGNLYSEKESTAMYDIMTQNKLSGDQLNFWTSGTRKLNSSTFTWQDGETIPLFEFNDFCVAALKKYGMQSFVISDYPCEKPLNFLCIDKDMAEDFSRIRKLVGNSKAPNVFDGNSNSIINLKTEQPQVQNENLPDVVDSSNEIPTQEREKRKEDDEKVENIPSKRNILTDTSENSIIPKNIHGEKADGPLNFLSCQLLQNKELEDHTIRVNETMATEEILKLSLLNRELNMAATKTNELKWNKESEWKKEIIDLLAAIFIRVCPNDPYATSRFINVVSGLNGIYQNSIKPFKTQNVSVWTTLKKRLRNCKNMAEPLNLNRKGYLIYGVDSQELRPLEELADFSPDLDLIIDSLWYLTTVAHSACYKEKQESRKIETPWRKSNLFDKSNNNYERTLWFSHFKTQMAKDFFEPLGARWLHSGAPLLSFGPIFGSYSLKEAIRNMRYCAVASYHDSQMIDLQLVRAL